ncbi:MAG: heavy metal translocating P-type ATPase [Candidatus Parabeggiatoa sp. nov. 1]|nr:MAG: heavy metal translocating P-type ATPase [Gammaproteobacteria bacterium]
MLIETLLIGGALAFRYRHKKRKTRTLSAKSNQPKAKQVPYNWYQKTKTTLRAFKKAVLIPLTGGEVRHQQLNEMMPVSKNQKPNALLQGINQRIRLFVGLILGIVGAWMFPQLKLVVIAGTIYLIFPIVQKGYQDLKMGRITTYLLDFVTLICLIAMGYLLLVAFLIFFGILSLKLLIQTEDNSHRQLANMFGQQPHFVWVKREGVEVEVSFSAIHKEDIVIVNAGEVIPVDGIVSEGLATIDQHTLTGESQSVEKEAGDDVFAATIVLTGRLGIRVESTGKETVTAKIGDILQKTSDYKDTLRARGQKIADRFVLPTLLASAVAWPVLGANAALVVLNSSLGYNMRLLGPLTVLNFLHLMAKNGILIKDGRSLEMLQRVDTVVFDKTGTLTLEQPQVGHLYPLINGLTEEDLLIYAAAAEYRQKHPIAKAIVAAAKQRRLNPPLIDEAAYQVGYGIQVKIEEKIVRVGSTRFMHKEGIAIPPNIQTLQAQGDENGHSLVYVALDDKLAGVIELQPSIRPEAQEIIHQLKQRGMSLYIISGDHEQATRNLAKKLKIDHYFAEILPEQKGDLVADLRSSGKFVCFVGDGINDAIALKQANVSISLRGASTAATDTAQIILMDSSLDKINQLFEISNNFENNLHINYLTTIVPGVVCLGGMLFFHLSILGAVMLFYAGTATGLTNTMLPLLKYTKHDELSKK